MKTEPQRIVACEHYLNAATALRNEGKYPSALMSAQEALALARGEHNDLVEVRALNFIGICEMEDVNDPHSAIHHFQLAFGKAKAKNWNEQMIQSLLNLANAYMLLEDFEQAFSHVEQANKLRENDEFTPDILNLASFVFYSVGEYQAALDILHKLAKQKLPEHIARNLDWRLATCYGKLDLFDKARDQYEKVAKHNPSPKLRFRALVNITLLALDHKRMNLLASLYAQVRSKANTPEEKSGLYAVEAKMALARNDPKAAMDAFTKATEYWPTGAKKKEQLEFLINIYEAMADWENVARVQREYMDVMQQQFTTKFTIKAERLQALLSD
jgi:tetratricopeptide (TPR) repeat protein